MAVRRSVDHGEALEKRVLEPAAPEPPAVAEVGALGRSPLFSSQITGLDGLLRGDARRRVRRVVLLCEDSGLSNPLMHCAILAHVLPENFPNANFVDYSGLLGLVKMPSTSGLLIPESRFNTGWKELEPGWEDSVTFKAPIGTFHDPEYSDKVSSLTITLPSFDATMEDMRVGVGTRRGYEAFKIGRYDYAQYQDAKDVQYRMLARMGLSGLPRPGEPLVLTPDRFSTGLNEAIGKVAAVLEEKAGGKPLLLVNTGKRNEEHFRGREEMDAALAKIAKNLDVAVVVNIGPPTGDMELHTQGYRLFRQLEEVEGRKATLIDLGRFDLMHLAAVMHTAKSSGGCFIDAFGGPSFLAEWMDTPEVQVQIAGWKDFIPPRKNLTRLPSEGFGQDLYQAVVDRKKV